MDAKTRSLEEKSVADAQIALKQRTADEEAEKISDKWLEKLESPQPSDLCRATIKSWRDYELVFNSTDVTENKRDRLQQKFEDLGYTVLIHEDNWGKYFHVYDGETRRQYKRRYGAAKLFTLERTNRRHTNGLTPLQQVYQDLQQLCNLGVKTAEIKEITNNIQETVEKIHGQSKSHRESLRAARQSLLIECAKMIVLVVFGTVWLIHTIL